MAMSYILSVWFMGNMHFIFLWNKAFIKSCLHMVAGTAYKGNEQG